MSIILGVYIIIQILILSSLMVMEVNFTLHAITMSLSCIAYFVVAFKNPGYFEGEMKETPSIEDEIRKQIHVPSDQKIIKQMDEEQQANDESQKDQDLEIRQENLQQENAQKIVKKQIEPQQDLKKPELDENIDQNIIKAKFPHYPSQKIKKLTQLNSDQIDFMQKKSTQPTQHRYCRICKVFQPSRVRHCHQCQKCILTFDHHCPWMNNCIGQKNRNIFWLYLLLQFVEFFLVFVDLGEKAMQVTTDKARVYFFTVSVLFVTIVAFLLLVFHTYLMLKNFTTWEYVRWDRINYLSIYSYKKSSPFSYGFVRNLTDYFLPGKEPKQWTINPEFLKFNSDCQQKLKQGKSQKSIPSVPKLKNKGMDRAQTERAIISRGQP